jgi:hypothetical protein
MFMCRIPNGFRDRAISFAEGGSSKFLRNIIELYHTIRMSRDSVVDIETGYGLDYQGV